MSAVAQSAGKEQGIEYSIYTFNMPVSGQKNANEWEKQDTKTERSDAISTAEKLLSSGKYSKVEIKQKYFDKKKNRNIDMTLKTYEAKPKMEINAFMILVFAIVCGGLAFAVTYFLSQ